MGRAGTYLKNQGEQGSSLLGTHWPQDGWGERLPSLRDGNMVDLNFTGCC